MIKIETAKLKIAFDKIIKKLAYENVEEVESQSDFYRIIPSDKWNVGESHEEELGSLWDDIEAINELIDNDDRPCTYVDFDRVASILRMISQIRNPPDHSV